MQKQNILPTMIRSIKKKILIHFRTIFWFWPKKIKKNNFFCYFDLKVWENELFYWIRTLSRQYCGLLLGIPNGTEKERTLAIIKSESTLVIQRNNFLKAGPIMKVSSSIKRRCESCQIIKRKGVVRVVCTNPRHKQKQG